MIGDADAEVLLADWLHTRLGYKIWRDPVFPANAWATAPAGHLLRGQDFDTSPLALDRGLFDLDFYAAQPDKAREAARRALMALTLDLPLHTFSNGLLCKSVSVLTSPFWAPAVGVSRRSATYRIVLHGYIAP